MKTFFNSIYVLSLDATAALAPELGLDGVYSAAMRRIARSIVEHYCPPTDERLFADALRAMSQAVSVELGGDAEKRLASWQRRAFPEQPQPAATSSGP